LLAGPRTARYLGFRGTAACKRFGQSSPRHRTCSQPRMPTNPRATPRVAPPNVSRVTPPPR